MRQSRAWDTDAATSFQDITIALYSWAVIKHRM
jgi:hypothetical protein